MYTIFTMPIIHKEEARHNTQLAIWEIHEEMDYFMERLELTQSDQAFLDGIHPRRAIEWAASRYLLKVMLDRAVPFDCLVDDHGKPYIPDDPRHISISHSYGMASIALSDAPIGIDIQRETHKITRLYHKFVSDAELQVLDPLSEADMHLFWSAKEAMFKLHGKGELDFRKHLHIDLHDHITSYGKVPGKISKGDLEIRCEIHYRFIHSYIWVYALPV